MSEFNPSAFIAGRLRAAGAALHGACEKMPEERLTWRPTTEGHSGRDTLDQVLECSYLNEWAAAAFRQGAVTSFDNADFEQKQNAHRNRNDALRWLHEATNSLASAVESFPTRRLSETVTHPFTGKPINWAEFADFFYWNTVYHEGQVNYVQTLYGDLS